ASIRRVGRSGPAPSAARPALQPAADAGAAAAGAGRVPALLPGVRADLGQREAGPSRLPRLARYAAALAGGGGLVARQPAARPAPQAAAAAGVLRRTGADGHVLARVVGRAG